MKLRYYSSSAPTVTVQVNGGSAQTVNLPHSGSWNIVWAEQTVSVNLAAGNNTIRIQGAGGGSCRQDRIYVNSNANARVGTEDQEARRFIHRQKVSLSNIPSGTYLVQLKGESGSTSTRTVILK